jgi:macrodomain Ter protein organizer (MatP/YcbG family)
MALNIMHQRILEYLEINISLDFANRYNDFLSTGKKIDRNKLKVLAKFVKSKNTISLEKELLSIFSPIETEINVTVQDKKNTLLKSSFERVKKHRNNLKQKGYKNLSINLSAEDFKKLKVMKLKKQMTHSQFISFLINQ